MAASRMQMRASTTSGGGELLVGEMEGSISANGLNAVEYPPSLVSLPVHVNPLQTALRTGRREVATAEVGAFHLTHRAT